MNKYCSEHALHLAEARVGDALAVLRKQVGEMDVVRFCATIRNFHRYHYDQAFMQAQGHPQIIVPGFMIGNWCLEAATRAFVPPHEVAGLKFRNTRMAPVGTPYEIAGQVSALEEGGRVRCVFEVTQVDAEQIVASGQVVLRTGPSAPCP